MADQKLKLLETLLCLCAILPCVSCNQVASHSTLNVSEQTQAVTNADEIEPRVPLPSIQYEFELVSIETRSNDSIVGLFRFLHHHDESLELWGFGFVNDEGKWVNDSNAFIPRFEQIKVRDSENDSWEYVPNLCCGTGATRYALHPNQEYTVTVPLWTLYPSKNERLGGLARKYAVVELSGDKFEVVSKPFDTNGAFSMSVEKIFRENMPENSDDNSKSEE